MRRVSGKWWGKVGLYTLTYLIYNHSPTFSHPYNAILYGSPRGVEDAAPYGWVVDGRCGIVMMCMKTGMYMYVSATLTA